LRFSFNIQYSYFWGAENTSIVNKTERSTVSFSSDFFKFVDEAGFCSGRVELKSNQSWTSACEADFDRQDAEVVCRQLVCSALLRMYK
jgi:hypothetical protein